MFSYYELGFRSFELNLFSQCFDSVRFEKFKPEQALRTLDWKDSLFTRINSNRLHPPYWCSIADCVLLELTNTWDILYDILTFLAKNLIFVILVLCLIIGCGNKTGKIRPTAEKLSFFRVHMLLSTKEEFTQVYCGAKKKVDFCDQQRGLN